MGGFRWKVRNPGRSGIIASPGEMAVRKGENMASTNACDTCNNLVYDEELEEYVCDMDLDEDDLARLYSSHYRECPYYQSDNEYEVVKHQAF